MAQAKEAIKAMREARGWSLAELARRAGCDAGYIGRVERGERVPTRYFVAHLAETLSQTDDDQDAA